MWHDCKPACALSISSSSTGSSTSTSPGERSEREAIVPTQSTIFEGHFPGYPLMPGVLLLETMAQTSGWLIIGLTKFTRMPFLAAFKEAKLRSFVTPGTVADRQR